MKSGCVLVVEDEALIRSMLAEALQDAGFVVQQAHTGDQAAQILAEHDGFAAVVTDINTPGERDGIDVGRLVGELHPGTPVIYVTGRPETLAGTRLGADETFLVKPYAPSQIVEVLRTKLGG